MKKMYQHVDLPEEIVEFRYMADKQIVFIADGEECMCPYQYWFKHYKRLTNYNTCYCGEIVTADMDDVANCNGELRHVDCAYEHSLETMFNI